MLSKNSCVLTVIDIQDKLMPRDAAAVNQFLQRVIKLVRCAQLLEIPILITEQNPNKLGATNEQVAAVVGDAPRYAKMEFGCLENTEFNAALKQQNRKQLLIVGMEGHICVMQTVLRALEEHYETHVVADCILSRDAEEYRAGLARMDKAGAAMVTSEMAIFELLKAAGTDDFRRMLPLLKE